MIAVLKPGTTDAQIENLSSWIKLQGLDVHLSRGSLHTVIGLVGDTSKIDADLLEVKLNAFLDSLGEKA